MSEDKPRGDDARTGEPTHVKAVDGDVAPTTLTPRHLEDLRSSGLTDETINGAGLSSIGTSKGVADILGWGWRNGGALAFPFFDYDSRRVVIQRVKPDKPRVLGKKRRAVKYEQAPNTGPVPYLGPGTIREQRLDKARGIVYWAEGEKKTLTLDQLGYAVVGITGCHVWNDAETYRNGDGLTWSKELRKYAERFVKGRAHVICYDSDAFDNDNVMLALRRLAGLLLADGAASVRFVRIPPSDDKAIKGVGIDDYFVEHGEKKTRALLDGAELIELGAEIQPIPPKDPLMKLASLKWLRPAKLPKDLRLPPRFEVRRDRSLWLEPDASKPDADWKETMRAVVIPTALLPGADDDEDQCLEVAYFSRQGWKRATVRRKAIRDTRRALAELPADVAIDSNNASAVVGWFSEYMRHNEHRLDVRALVSRSGWHGEENETFVTDVPISRARAPAMEVAGTGDREDLLRALRPVGTLAAHTDAIRRAFDEDRQAAILILGALAAPLLKPLHADNFGIHLAGDSSRGKTSKLVCAASIFGDPRNAAWLASWNTTLTAMEIRAASLCDLPLCYDEIGAGDKGQIEKSIYVLINGSGRGRAQKTLTARKTLSWRSVVLSTGEHLLASEQANTGAQIRILQYRVRGFGGLDAAGVDAVRNDCQDNAGRVGRAWLEALVTVEDWAPLRDMFSKVRREFREQEGKEGSLSQRQAGFYALLAVTEHLAARTLGFGRKGGGTIRYAYADADGTGEAVEVETAGARALRVVQDWIVSEPATFPELIRTTDGKLAIRSSHVARNVNGVWHDGWLYLIPGPLQAHLTRAGLSESEARASWGDMGITKTTGKRKLYKASWGGNRTYVVALSGSALDREDEEKSDDFSEQE